ncbi:uncharacterized protein LOC108863738 [Galendromus occidentalis]|uniref:Uncharacterized protein LOC108863738 n=1 Tax=Galendromus occidentalis TaxID=34638 RepID=A0AAJ7SDC5_9ACAR|nr:uncharacterized protein LOC108863738 [Galendromus occidentalis]
MSAFFDVYERTISEKRIQPHRIFNVDETGITVVHAEHPVLLVLDGHYSHTRNIELIDLAEQNHISILCLPPYCTHRMQPLDDAFMSPFKTYYAQEIETWLRNNPSRALKVSCIGKVFGIAYKRAATMQVSASGFRATGLLPIKRNVFSSDDFAAVETIAGDNLRSGSGHTHYVCDSQNALRRHSSSEKIGECSKELSTTQKMWRKKTVKMIGLMVPLTL